MNNKHINQLDVVLSLENISRVYIQGDNKINVLNKINLDMRRGEMYLWLVILGQVNHQCFISQDFWKNQIAVKYLRNKVKCSKMTDFDRTTARRVSFDLFINSIIYSPILLQSIMLQYPCFCQA